MRMFFKNLHRFNNLSRRILTGASGVAIVSHYSIIATEQPKQAKPSPAQVAAVVNQIKELPITPAQSLFSRRRQAVEILGDVILFPLKEETTNPEFVKTIKAAQQTLYALIENDLGIANKTWANKEVRHQEKAYKRHKYLHLAFACSVYLSSAADYETKKRSYTAEQFAQAEYAINIFIKHTPAIEGKVKECKLNNDGHMVVRVEIQPSEALLVCKQTLSNIFGGSFNRYKDPEKQTTLATVIGVVDHNKLSAPVKAELETRLKQLELDLKALGTIPLNSIEWMEYNRRTLSPDSQLSVREFHRMC